MQATITNSIVDDDQVELRPVRKILYVEDNLDSLKLMQSIVGQMPNASLIIAHNAKLGIALAKQKKPDLILLDINMPGMNGIEALGLLRHMEITRHIPVVALTANADPKDKERGLAMGFNDYLTKPVKVKEIIQKINGIFEDLK